jgi:hypothetical protein
LLTISVLFGGVGLLPESEPVLGSFLPIQEHLWLHFGSPEISKSGPGWMQF